MFFSLYHRIKNARGFGLTKKISKIRVVFRRAIWILVRINIQMILRLEATGWLTCHLMGIETTQPWMNTPVRIELMMRATNVLNPKIRAKQSFSNSLAISALQRGKNRLTIMNVLYKVYLNLRSCKNIKCRYSEITYAIWKAQPNAM